MKQIILVPIDNRPVTYVYPQNIARIAGIEALAPPRQIMGSLSHDASVDAIHDWIANNLRKHNPEAVLLCADSIIYGGLIPSRRITTGLAQLLERAKLFSQVKKINARVATVYAQSSIMRISDNYDNTEEKAYWTRYGREIFAWSEMLHRTQAVGDNHPDDKTQAGKLQQLEARIEPSVRDDYLSTRNRNFELNRKLIDFVEAESIDLLIFSQDDSGQFGLNVLEKERLLDEAQRRGLNNVIAYAGADEVICAMLSRYLLASLKKTPSVKVSFSPATGASITSLYEGQTIGESVQKQLAAAGLVAAGGSPLTGNDHVAAAGSPLTEGNGAGSPDLHIIIHTGDERQGDHIWLPDHLDLRSVNTRNAVESTLKLLESSTSPVILCDVAYANGSDPALVEALLEKPGLLEKLWGYAGWNTTGNTLGSAFATGVARWYAEQTNVGPQATKALKDALFVRLADDWAFQTNVRSHIANNASTDQLHQLMSPLLTKISNALGHQPGPIQMRLPWQRTFEVEIKLPDSLMPIL
ncbi:MAG TPA: DUF4127 family protein [Candidatus Obscuribacterales bacterium]